jgi:tryptophan synthase alpha subunit
LKGVTGAATLDAEAVARKLKEIRAVTDLPIGVGFGIRDGASAARVAAVADAVVSTVAEETAGKCQIHAGAGSARPGGFLGGYPSIDVH